MPTAVALCRRSRGGSAPAVGNAERPAGALERLDLLERVAGAEHDALERPESKPHLIAASPPSVGGCLERQGPSTGGLASSGATGVRSSSNP
jgi:hypothetical protein